jgi:DNA-binding CsgD family transcriptional regulator
MADQFELEDVAVWSLDVIGSTMSCLGDPAGIDLLHDALDRAKRAELVSDACRISSNLGLVHLFHVEPERAVAVYSDGVALAEEHELVYRRNCLITTRLDAYVVLGRWDDATADAHAVLDQPNLAPHHRGLALWTIGRIQARRGDPGAAVILAQALEIVEAVGEPQFIAPVRVSLAEAAWLAGDETTARAQIECVLPLAEVLEPHALRDLARWAHRTGCDRVPQPRGSKPQPDIPNAAAAFWDEHGCPYEAADGLADSDDEHDLREALERLLNLDARPRAQQVARRLRDLGVRDVRRGPRAMTRANAARLTARELEVATLLVGALTNAEIADRLVLSPKTVDHHVSAVLSKLGVSNRRLVAEAARGFGLDLARDLSDST